MKTVSKVKIWMVGKNHIEFFSSLSFLRAFVRVFERALVVAFKGERNVTC